MRLLLIDNSNTRTKFAISDPRDGMEPSFWEPTDRVDRESLERLLGHREFEAAVICSVVPSKQAILEAFVAHRGIVHSITHRSPLGLKIDYPDPHHVGADRLANAVGVIHRHGCPAVVIDFGTAVTFDVITTGPCYAGGVIAPGLGAMRDYLGAKTALLPTVDLAEPKSAIGKSTAEAMRAGVIIGYRGLVKEIVGAIRAELPEPAKTVATGGDAALIAAGVPEIDCVDPDLTLSGIELIGRRVFG